MPDPEKGPQEQEPIENQGLPIERPGGSQDLDEGLSTEGESTTPELPEAYKPYKEVVPWERIPEEVREDALQGIKKFHGDLTRDHQEVAEFKKQVPELQNKAKLLDYLTQQPEVQDAIKSVQNRGNGQNYQQQQPQQQSQTSGLDKLSEYGFDSDVGKLLKEEVNRQVSSIVSPITGQVQQLEQQVADRSVQDQLDKLGNTAKSNGLPDPRSRLSDIRKVISDRRASNVSDAYFLAIQDDLPGIYTERAQKEMKDKFETKAQNTSPPGFTPATTPTNGLFTGNDALEKALKASEQELGIKK